MLSDLHPKRGVNDRAVSSKGHVRRDAAVTESDLQIRTPIKTLVIGEIYSPSILRENRHAIEQARRDGLRVIFLQSAGYDRIKAGDRWTEAESGTDQAVSSGTNSASTQTGTSR